MGRFEWQLLVCDFGAASVRLGSKGPVRRQQEQSLARGLHRIKDIPVRAAVADGRVPRYSGHPLASRPKSGIGAYGHSPARSDRLHPVWSGHVSNPSRASEIDNQHALTAGRHAQRTARGHHHAPDPERLRLMPPPGSGRISYGRQTAVAPMNNEWSVASTSQSGRNGATHCETGSSLAADLLQSAFLRSVRQMQPLAESHQPRQRADVGKSRPLSACHPWCRKLSIAADSAPTATARSPRTWLP